MTDGISDVGLVDPADLVSQVEIAAEFGVSHAAISYWTRRDDFPPPAAVVGGRTRVWLMSEVRRWRETHQRPTERQHGASSYANSLCRCGICRQANTERARWERVVRRTRLAADPSLAPHGRSNTYRNWGCRCGPCTDANSAACASRRSGQSRYEGMVSDEWGW